MRTEIKKLHQNLNASMVYVTHDQIEAMTLATKIVVMQGGIIQQIGTPAEIYSYPANLFVADFMGSPAMNLIPAKVEKNGKGSKFIINQNGINNLVLTDRATTNLPQDIVLGIRPEDIGDAALQKRRSNQVCSCKIDVVEPAGADTYVLMSLGELKSLQDFRPKHWQPPGSSWTCPSTWIRHLILMPSPASLTEALRPNGIKHECNCHRYWWSKCALWHCRNQHGTVDRYKKPDLRPFSEGRRCH